MENLAAQSQRRPLAASRASSQRGVALVFAMLALVLLSALGLALVAATSSETVIAGNFRVSAETSYAADAIAGRALVDLRTAADWTPVLSGSTRSTFVDGAPSGPRTLLDRSIVDLTKVVNLANCNKATTCRPSDMDAVSAARPWGRNNPRWQLYAYGPLSRLIPGDAVRSACYALAMVGDDPAETDGNPLQDATDPQDPGAGVVALRVEAFGPQSAHKTIEITLARQPSFRLLSWRP